jgi:hypothetical protein
MALDDLRCSAPISVGIGAISDIKGGLGGLKSGAYDPYVWSGRAVQEVFLDPGDDGLASMYPACDWSMWLPAIMDISAHAI